ncbi:MAG: tetraacyldisaccharide 4'-kinase [Acidobacteriota bacterium]|nr:tetraacyldisaccharide 4'-kinase [Acidobacteriota bacterium]
MTRPLLFPLVPLYRFALALRELRLGTSLEPVRHLRFPVVSIGSLSAGGSGKTPLTIALAQALMRRSLHVDVLSRGYGRQSDAVTRVDPSGTAAEFGDEPLLIARAAGVPVYVATQRYRAGLLAEAAPSESNVPAVHLLDDGFQHRQLHRDVNILLLDAQDFEDHLLPAGNLREPLRAIRRAHVIAIPADNPELESRLKASNWQGTVWHLRRCMQVPPIDGPVVAFCGIARSKQFFAGLEAAGLHLASRLAFPDHHLYVQHDLDCIQDAARSTAAAAFVTTEKDRVRLGELAAAFSESRPLKTAQLCTEIEDEDTVIDRLTGRLPGIL